MNIALPPTGTAGTPAFADLAACQDWIKRLPLLNPTQAQKQLNEQLALLNAYTLPGGVRLNLLEALQVPIRFVQGESANLFSGKALPLAPIEQAAIEATHTLWQALLMGYLRCLENLLAGDAALEPQAALLCQRALAALTDDFADLLRAGHHPEASLWGFAHRIFASAESLGAAQTPVADFLRGEQATLADTDTLRGYRPVSPTDTYVELVLIASASLHELAPRQQCWVQRWARRWAAKVAVLKAPPDLGAALPLCVDLEGDAPPGFMPASGSGARWFDTVELRKSMKKRLVLLSRGDAQITPAALGLGEDCTQPTCGEVLQRVYPRWVKGGVQRRYARHPLRGTCRFVTGIDAIHYYVSGHQPFRPPGSTSSEDLRRQREELALFGQVATRHIEQPSREQGYQLESWTLVEDWGLFDESADGLCLVRPLAQSGARLGDGQLAAVQPSGRSDMLLGVVRWTQQRGDQLVAGIQLVAGHPEPVAVRRTGVMATPDKYQPGFLLGDQLILPPGSHKAERIMETWTPMATRRFRLGMLVERGADFELSVCAASE